MRWRSSETMPLLVGLVALTVTGATRADDEPGPIEPAEVTLGRPADFQKDVLPILRAKCLACHSASKKEGGLVLESVASILKGGDSGPAVEAGNVDESLLALSARRSEDASPMPPIPNDANAAPLTQQELGVLLLWIREGAKESTQAQRMIQWQQLPGQIDAVYSLAMGPAEQLIAAGRGNQIHLYDLIRQRQLQVLGDPALASDAASQPIAHRDIVSSLAFSPDGNWIASGGYRIVKLWQRAAPLQQRRQIDGPATTLATSNDGRWVAAALGDGHVRIWDRHADSEGGVFKVHDAAASAVAFNQDGTQVLSAEGPVLKQWDAATGEAKGQLTAPSPIRVLRVLAEGAKVATGHEDGVIRIWNVDQLTLPPAEGEENAAAAPAQELTGHGKPVTAFGWSTAEGPRLVSASEDGTLRLWDLEQGKEARQIAHGSPVSVLAISTDGSQLASAGPDGIVRVWNAKGEKLAEVSGDPRPARQLARLQQNQKVAQARKALADTDVTNAEKDVKEREESLMKAQEQVAASEKTVSEAQPKLDEAQKKVEEATAALAEMPEDEARKKAKTDAEAALAKEQEALKAAQDALASAKRGAELAEKSLAAMQTNLEQRKKRQADEVAREAAATAAVTEAQEQAKAGPAPVRGLAFAPDGSWLAAADEAARIVIWHVGSQQALDVLTAEPGAAIHALAPGGDGRLLAATADGHVDTWSGEPSFKLAGHLGPADESGLDVSASPIEDRVLAIDFSPDGKLLALGSGIPSRSGQVQLWDVAGRMMLREIADSHSDTVFDVAFSRDGVFLATGAADKFAKVFDVASGALQRSFEGHTGHVMSVAWKADGSVLATGGADNAIKAWTTATGEQQRTISSHTKPVNAVTFVGIEEKLVSAAGDKAVLMHTVSNGRNYRRLDGSTDFLHAVVVSSDETRVAAGCEDGLVRVWNGTDGKLLMSFPTQ
jgi:WD40 repeat protein